MLSANATRPDGLNGDAVSGAAVDCYGIPPHIHACVTRDGAVILDVKRDKYLGLGRQDAKLLANAVAGWPKPSWRKSACSDAHTDANADGEKDGYTGLREAAALCESLTADGVLERIPRGRQARVVVALGNMRGEWISIGDEVEVRGQLALGDIANFLAAYAWARCSLAWRPFSVVVDEVRKRKIAGKQGFDGSDPEKVAACVDVFRRLRPLVFAAEGRCLLHALTLIRFLSNYAVYPDWVIGVTTQPWGAHSWVQWGNYLLDSNPEKVCAYTPIMMV
jgi:hypothetical protein